MCGVTCVFSMAGAVRRVGRCDSYATEFDLEAEEYVPMPKGDVHKKKEIVQVRDLLPRIRAVHASVDWTGRRNGTWA